MILVWIGIIILVTIILLVKYYNTIHTVPVLSTIDDSSYNVNPSLNNMQLASDNLAKLNNIGIELLRALRDKYSLSLTPRGDVTRQLLSKYNPDNIVEHSPKLNNSTSYVVNKGNIIAICLRDKSGEEIHDVDILSFVFIHELSHIAIPDTDHTQKFWQTFKFLLAEAEQANLYISPKFTADNSVLYCGIQITYNPLYDDKLPFIR